LDSIDINKDAELEAAAADALAAGVDAGKKQQKAGAVSSAAKKKPPPITAGKSTDKQATVSICTSFVT
jgi:hypothetical protein